MIVRVRVNRYFLLLAVAGFITGCATADPQAPGPVSTGSVNFTRYVAVGNSLTAGVQSGGLVDKFQRLSYPALIAESARVSSFAMPLVAEPGNPPLLVLNSIVPTIDIGALPGPPGLPTNLAFPGIYNNLGIPGADVHDLLVRRPSPSDVFGLVLRDTTLGPTAVAQAVNAQPTLLTVWIGANDILGSATSGTDLLLTSTALFESDYRAVIDALNAASGAMVVANIPDIVAIPFFSTIPPFVVDPVTRLPVLDPANNVIPLIGSSGNIAAGARVTLLASDSLAQGVGIPTMIPGGTGRPLPDFMVLTPAELATIQDRITSFNAIIDSITTNRGIPVADMFALFNQVDANGVMLRGEKFTTDFISGGLFSLDGVHPSSLGYFIVAQEFIKTINASFGASLPDPPFPIDPGLAAATTSAGPSPLDYVAALPPGAFDGLVRMLGGSRITR